MEPIRWTTVHPALVHLPIGTLLFAALAYGIAVRRASRRWAFAGDVAGAFGVISLLAASAFGVLAFILLDWPGALGQWPMVHLVLGGASTILVLALAVIRLRQKRHAGRRIPGLIWSRAAGAGAMLIVLTAWVGGEVLAFHGGMAVRASGMGALAPLVGEPASPPKTVREAMGTLRASWAHATTALARSIVERPSEERRREIQREARRIQELASWLTHGPHPPGVHGHAQSAGHGEPNAERFAQMARALEASARELVAAAGSDDVVAMARALGETTAQCASCHESARWELESEAREQADTETPPSNRSAEPVEEQPVEEQPGRDEEDPDFPTPSLSTLPAPSRGLLQSA